MKKGIESKISQCKIRFLTRLPPERWRTRSRIRNDRLTVRQPTPEIGKSAVNN